jgi:hypothetical protein
MRNLTATISADAYPPCAGLCSPTRHFHSQQSPTISSKRAPEDVICQRFPIPNHNPSIHIQVQAANFPNLKNSAFFMGETVEKELTQPISIP